MTSEDNKEYSVNWKNHMNHVRKAFDNLLNSNELTDVTLCCEGRKIGAHKMLLSACSGYFRDTFKEVPCKHPVIVLYGVEYNTLSDILHFMYNGEVSVDTSKLDSFLKVAQLLQISGLTDDANDSRVETSNVEHLDSTVSDLGMEETFAEPTTSTSKAVKRVRTKEAGGPQYKVQKQDSDISKQTDTVLISDVKCEPSELVSFEDPLEDPLQSDHSYDSRQLYENATDQNVGAEEMKIEFESTRLLDFKTDTKVKSNFSEDCLRCTVCNKMFSHPYSLQHHKAVHSGNTRCPICHAVLSRKYNLKMHMRARHNL